MAGGYFTKTGVSVSPKYLNNVNDTTEGGLAITGVPSGAPQAQVSQTRAGDRICLDDATALALSLTTTGTLYGGLYQYVLTDSTATASPAVGSIAFFLASAIGTSYKASSDVQPTTTNPTYVWGVFINAATKGNYCWIQIAGIASVLFDSTVTGTTAGSLVTAKASASVASTAENAAAITQITAAALIGVSVGTVTTSTVSKVAMTRGFGRI